MVRWTVSLLLSLACVGALASDAPHARLEHTEFDFGRVSAATAIRHEFRISNAGATPLRIERAALTPPLRLAAMRAEIAPGAEATLRVSLNPAALSGRFEGQVIVYTNDPAAPEITLSISGEVVPPIELTPLPELFLAGGWGRSAIASIDIVNHEALPLMLAPPQHSMTHFTSRIETIEPGQRYRLSIALKPDAPTGKHRDDITLATSSHAMPLLTIPANTLLRERVYTFPEALDLGALPLSAVRADPELLRRSAQTLMVYQSGGRDFRISATSDVAGLSIAAERAASGDRYQLLIALESKRPLAAGPLQGSIFIRTNDPEFPTMRVPVSGALLGD